MSAGDFMDEVEREERAGGVYDSDEVSVLVRMKRVLMDKHGWDREDFEGMTFLDIEDEFLELEPDFRPGAE